MTKRKLFLLTSCAIFFAIYLVQIIFSLQSSVKIKKLNSKDASSIDKIEINANGNNFFIVRENEKWFLGNEKYLADENKIATLLDTISKVTLLDTISNRLGESEKAQYEITNSFKVVAKSNEKIVRTIFVGKNASTISQNYISLDDEKKVYLASGDLRSQFEKTIGDLRSMKIFSLKANDIVSLSTKTKLETLQVQKENDVWKLTNAKTEIDSEKIANWISSIANLSASTWLSKDFVLPQERDASVEIKTQAETISLDLYKNENTYFAKSNASEYPFELNEYDAKRFLKNESDFQKAELKKE